MEHHTASTISKFADLATAKLQVSCCRIIQNLLYDWLFYRSRRSFGRYCGQGASMDAIKAAMLEEALKGKAVGVQILSPQPVHP